MGLLAGFRAGFYRFTNDGRRVFEPFSLRRMRRVHFLVPDSEVRSFERRYLWFFLVMCVGVIPISTSFLLERPWAFLLFVAVIPPLATRFWLTRGLSPVSLQAGDFPPTDRRARALAHALAMGEPALWVMLLAVIAMGGGQVWILLTTGEWWAWIGVALFGACAVAMARQIYLLRRAPPTGPPAGATGAA